LVETVYVNDISDAYKLQDVIIANIFNIDINRIKRGEVEIEIMFKYGESFFRLPN